MTNIFIWQKKAEVVLPWVTRKLQPINHRYLGQAHLSEIIQGSQLASAAIILLVFYSPVSAGSFLTEMINA